MGANLVLNVLKVTLLGLVTVLLAVEIWQDDAIESRLQNLQTAVADVEDRLGELPERTAEKVGTVAVVPAGSDHTGAGRAEMDPRTLPYWPTEDNILVDPKGEPKPPPDAPRGGTIYYYTLSNPRSLNVHVLNEAQLQERICAPVYEYIADQSRVDPDEYVPGICNRVTVNEDYTEFTCYVRKGMYWHRPFLTEEERRGALRWLAKLPPQEVTAEDIKFTFDVVMNPRSECSSQRIYLTEVESVEVLDRYTARIRWKKSRYYNKGSTLNLLMIFPAFIYTRDRGGEPIPEDLVASTFPKHWHDRKMCGTGPFMFDGFEDNQYVKLVRNDDWWNPNGPVIDGIYLHIKDQPEVLLDMFKSGKLDVFSAQPSQYRSEILEGGPGSVKRMVEEGKATVKEWEMFSYYYVGWNMRQPQLQDRQVRRALAHLFPKERIIRDVYYGLAVPHDGPVHRWENHYVPAEDPIELDVEKAKRLLDEAGWRMNARGVREKVVGNVTRELRIKMLYPTIGNLGRDIVLLFQKSAAQAGVILEPQGRDWQTMIKMLDDKDYEACVLGWGNTWDSDPSQIWHSDSARSAKGSNHVSYIQPELDEVIEKLEVEFDKEERRRLWRRFQEIVRRDQPYCFTVIRKRSWFVSNRLGNHYFARLRPQDWFLPWYVKSPK